MSRIAASLLPILLVLSACGRGGGEETPLFTPIDRSQVSKGCMNPSSLFSDGCITDDMEVMTCAEAHRPEPGKTLDETTGRDIPYECR